jgi:hypothetical protein
VKTRVLLGALFLCAATTLTTTASADSREVRREWREGAREVAQERREAAREIHACNTRDCVRREMREGQREIDRERRETRREVKRERVEDRWDRPRYVADRHARYQYVDAHYHPNGRYCRDGRHVAHLYDTWYRGDRRWYRDGRYWGENDYVTRYYRGSNDRHDDDDDLVKGILIGAAVVGVIAAIHEANDGD